MTKEGYRGAEYDSSSNEFEERLVATPTNQLFEKMLELDEGLEGATRQLNSILRQIDGLKDDAALSGGATKEIISWMKRLHEDAAKLRIDIEGFEDEMETLKKNWPKPEKMN